VFRSVSKCLQRAPHGVYVVPLAVLWRRGPADVLSADDDACIYIWTTVNKKHPAMLTAGSEYTPYNRTTQQTHEVDERACIAAKVFVAPGDDGETWRFIQHRVCKGQLRERVRRLERCTAVAGCPAVAKRRLRTACWTAGGQPGWAGSR